MKIKIIKDKYRKARDNQSTIYAIRCGKCGDDLFLYQKDGRLKQWLKRLYQDRIRDGEWFSGRCSSCKNEIANPITYEKENRPTWLLIKGSIKKKILYRG